MADLVTTYRILSRQSQLLYGAAAVFYEVQHRAMNAAHVSKILTGRTRGYDKMLMQFSRHFATFSTASGATQFSAAHRYCVECPTSPYPTCRAILSWKKLTDFHEIFSDQTRDQEEMFVQVS
jgi:hypothetical protein